MNIKQKILISIIAILFAIVGLFGVFYTTQNNSVVKADESTSSAYYFQSSQLIFPMSTFSDTNMNTSSATNYIYDNFVKFTFGLGDDYSISSRGDYGYIQIVSSHANGISTSTSQPTLITYQFHLTRGSWLNLLIPTGQSSRWYIISIYLSEDFNYNIEHVTITTEDESLGLSNLSATQLKYYDVNANELKVQLHFKNTLNNMNNYRYVYNNYYFSGFDTFTDNDYYQAGLQNGKNIGEQIGYDNGYTAGYDSGLSAGDSSGYNRGVNDANTYSFGNVLGAVFDAPISAIFGYVDRDQNSATYNQRVGGLLNFNFLGVNLSQFFMALLTFTIILLVIRLIIGGGK